MVCKYCQGRGCDRCPITRETNRPITEASSSSSHPQKSTRYQVDPQGAAATSASEHRMPSRIDDPTMRRMPSRLDDPSTRRMPSNIDATVRHSGQSTLITPYDQKMSQRQTSMPYLDPDQKIEQERWAQSQLTMNASATCPVGFKWVRCLRGYRCLGGSHYVFDELLQEGQGGYHLILDMIVDGRKDKLVADRSGRAMLRWPGKRAYYGAGDDPFWRNMTQEDKDELCLKVFGTTRPSERMRLWDM